MASFILGHNPEFYNELSKLVKIPANCTRLVLTLEVDSIATIEATTFAKEGTGEPITKTYYLTEKKENE